MAPQLTSQELDFIIKASQEQQLSATAIHAKLRKQRERKTQEGPDLTSVRRALKGRTHRRGAVETRGRKRKLLPRAVKALNTMRKKLQKKYDGDQEVHWAEVIAKARVTKVDPTTAARSVQAAGFNVKWRAPRQKPMRDPEHEQERVDVCDRLRKRPKTYFSAQLDLVMDNKHFEAPTHMKARRYLRKMKVRGHLRTRGEGLKRAYTKPNAKKHRVNPGGGLHVCAGIINSKVRLWHYLLKGR